MYIYGQSFSSTVFQAMTNKLAHSYSSWNGYKTFCTNRKIHFGRKFKNFFRAL